MNSLTNIPFYILIPVLVFSVVVHEMMHAYVALKLGDDLAHSRGRISWNPLNHIDPFLTILLPLILSITGLPIILAAKPVPINTSRIRGDEMGLAAVGIAGPLTNLALAFIAGMVFKLGSYSGLALEVVVAFILINIALFVFNMLPIPPLDGSRVLYAVAPEPVQNFMRQIESYGLMFLIVILLFASSVIGPILSRGNEIILNLVV